MWSCSRSRGKELKGLALKLVVMLEEQVQRAMNELKDTRKALEMDVAREEEFAKSITDLRYNFSPVTSTLTRIY